MAAQDRDLVLAVSIALAVVCKGEIEFTVLLLKHFQTWLRMKIAHNTYDAELPG